MPPTPPFTRPMPIPPRCGWRGGLRRAPDWRRWAHLDGIDTSGLHALLRASGLPREELLHMGASHELLSSSAPSVTWCIDAAVLLGRVAWDAIYGQAGEAYIEQVDCRHATDLGGAVIAEWFS